VRACRWGEGWSSCGFEIMMIWMLIMDIHDGSVDDIWCRICGRVWVAISQLNSHGGLGVDQMLDVGLERTHARSQISSLSFKHH